MSWAVTQPLDPVPMNRICTLVSPGGLPECSNARLLWIPDGQLPHGSPTAASGQVTLTTEPPCHVLSGRLQSGETKSLEKKTDRRLPLSSRPGPQSVPNTSTKGQGWQSSYRERHGRYLYMEKRDGFVSVNTNCAPTSSSEEPPCLSLASIPVDPDTPSSPLRQAGGPASLTWGGAPGTWGPKRGAFAQKAQEGAFSLNTSLAAGLPPSLVSRDPGMWEKEGAVPGFASLWRPA